MDAWWFVYAGGVKRALFVVAFLGAALWETSRPRQRLALPAGRRWLLQGVFLVMGSVLAALVFRASAIVVAISVADSPYGLLNRGTMPFALRALLTFLFLDLVQYADHYLRHAVPLLWRFHKVHHSDPDVDFSTGLRFHPGDTLFTHGVYLLAIAAASPPASVVFCFEACSVLQALFSHANISLPHRIERALRLVQVTPQLHEIHHSRRGADQRSNLGVLFSFWDRLFHTYRAHSVSGGSPLPFGVEDVTSAQSLRPWSMLTLPFWRAPGAGEASAPPARR